MQIVTMKGNGMVRQHILITNKSTMLHSDRTTLIEAQAVPPHAFTDEQYYASPSVSSIPPLGESNEVASRDTHP